MVLYKIKWYNKTIVFNDNKNLKNMANSRMLNLVEVKAAADVLWANVDVIDEYLAACAMEISEDHKQIIAALRLYQVMGKRREEKRIDKAIQNYEEELKKDPVPIEKMTVVIWREQFGK